LPLILTSVQLTLFALDGTSIEQAKYELAIVVSYDVIMLTVSYLLFDFIWKD
jgi:heme exporter protein B